MSKEKPALLPANLSHSLRLRHGRIAAENFCNLVVAFSANLNCVFHTQQGEQLFHIAIAQADASVRSGVSNRRRRVRSVNPVTLRVQAKPASAHRIALPGGITTP